MSEADSPRHRAIRSFVLRAGRMTDAQHRAMDRSWPRFGIDYREATLDLDALFGRRAPRVLEIGFGNGDHLAALAARRPADDFIGIEVHPPGVGHLLQLVETQALGNVRVSRQDAVDVLANQLPAQSLAEVLVLFPDPWHKKRHHKRRLIQRPFVDLLATRLAPSGVLRLATDWEPYAEHMLEILRAHPAFGNLAISGEFVERADRAATRFETRGQRLGHAVHDLAFQRR